jgi:hypothetical protein
METITLTDCIVLNVDSHQVILKNKKAENIFEELKNKNHQKGFYCNPYKGDHSFKVNNVIQGICVGMVISCTISVDGIITKGKSFSISLSLRDYTIQKDEYIFVDSDIEI